MVQSFSGARKKGDAEYGDPNVGTAVQIDPRDNDSDPFEIRTVEEEQLFVVSVSASGVGFQIEADSVPVDLNVLKDALVIGNGFKSGDHEVTRESLGQVEPLFKVETCKMTVNKMLYENNIQDLFFKSLGTFTEEDTLAEMDKDNLVLIESNSVVSLKKNGLTSGRCIVRLIRVV